MAMHLSGMGYTPYRLGTFIKVLRGYVYIVIPNNSTAIRFSL